MLAGSDRLKRDYAAEAARGTAIGAFALTEPDAGSDPAGITTAARRDGDAYVISGTKTYISNAGLASFYVVFARTGPGAGSKGLSAFVVDAAAPGFLVERQIPLLAPHPIRQLRFDECRVAADRRLGGEGDELTLALSTLDVFRSSVGAAACGISARALQRRRPMRASAPSVRVGAVGLSGDADRARRHGDRTGRGAALVYRAAWTKDGGAARVTRESSMAEAVRHRGGAADRRSRGADPRQPRRHPRHDRRTAVPRVRALRIYEGTSEIQRLVIAEQVLKGAARLSSSLRGLCGLCSAG